MGMYGWDPACETAPDVLAMREAARDELTGSDIQQAIAWDAGLSNDLDSLLLLASVSTDECDLGRQLRALVDSACELAVDGRLK